jgi:hypothetical protein
VGWTRPEKVTEDTYDNERTPTPARRNSSDNTYKLSEIPPLVLPPGASTVPKSAGEAQRGSEASVPDHPSPTVIPGLLDSSLQAKNESTAASRVRPIPSRHSLSSSVVNSPSVTPPPSVSTASSERLQSDFGTRSPRQSPTTLASATTNAKQGSTVPPSNSARISSTQPLPGPSTIAAAKAPKPSSTKCATSRSTASNINRDRLPPTIIKAAGIVPPRVSTATARAKMSESVASNSSPSSQTNQVMSALASSRGATPSANNDISDSALQKAVSSTSDIVLIPDSSTWSKRKPLTSEEAMQRPLRTELLPHIRSEGRECS